MLTVHANASAADGRSRDSIRYRELDRATDVSAAACLLRQSWTPPCLLYSDAYVKWQLAWPGSVRARAIVATAGTQIVGLIAIVPRRIRMRDRVSVVYVLSFFAVHPDQRGERVGAEMADRILAMSDRPTLAYTAPGASSERILARAAASRGWTFRRSCELRTYVRAAAGDHDRRAAVREATVPEFLAAVDRCGGQSVIAWSAPTVEYLQYYVADPRGACLAIARDSSSQTLGGALIVRSQVITARGVEHVPSLDSVFLEDPSATVISALATFARHRWPHDDTSVVTAPNLQTVAAGPIRSSDFRATRSAFNLSVMGEQQDPVVGEMTATNLEVF
jgi:hypothetical protein